MHDFIELNRLDREGYYSLKHGIKCLKFEGVINSAGTTIPTPTLAQGPLTYRGVQRAPSPLVGRGLLSLSMQSLPTPHPLASRAHTVEENNFKPALTIKNFKDVKGGVSITTDFADIDPTHKWRLVVTPTSDKTTISAFVEIICKYLEWSFPADVNIHILNKRNKYNLFDACKQTYMHTYTHTK